MAVRTLGVGVAPVRFRVLRNLFQAQIFTGLQALGADFYSFAGRQASPLEIGIFSGFFGWVIVGAQKPPRAHYYRPFFANCALFHCCFMLS